MTRDEVLQMPAGREMDALIAEKVMGEKIHRRSDETPHYLTWTPYSTDIAAAWQVVEKLRANDSACCPSIYWDDMDGMDPGEWVCVFAYYRELPEEFREYLAMTDTAPLAICRAALLAVMELDGV